MSKYQLRISQGRSTQPAFRLNWGGMASCLIAIGLIITTWFYSSLVADQRGVTGWFFFSGEWFGIAGLYALTAVVIERTLEYTPLARAWRYRLAFFASAGLCIVRWITLILYFDYPIDFIWLATGLTGSFSGGLLATSLKLRLWENNAPPPEHIQAAVWEWHREALGSLQDGYLKRWFDVWLSLLGLLISAPVWVLSSLIIWIEDPGPILFVKNSVGKNGVNFHQLKFRTMVREAENNTGPVLASEEDDRTLIVGRFLRKTALDELPQLINILRGDMSFVGPRPQRTVLVYGYLEKIPHYADRHRVRPGLAGLAQVVGSYYLTPRQKLRFDRLYLRYAGLGFDLKLVCLACLVTFWYRWHRGWNGRLPRRLLRLGSVR
jgi:lipopolysaccharide/colanic/teichoic acid biosynthesis glycosyltransferase